MGGGGSNPWMHPSPGVPTSLAVLEELLMLREVMAVGATLPPPPSCPLPPPLFPQLEDIRRTVLLQKTYLDNCYVTTKIINASCNGKGGPQLWHPLPNPMGAHKPPPPLPRNLCTGVPSNPQGAHTRRTPGLGSATWGRMRVRGGGPPQRTPTLHPTQPRRRSCRSS